MNCKLEKFWNNSKERKINNRSKWTVNLKSFEIDRVCDEILPSINEL